MSDFIATTVTTPEGVDMPAFISQDGAGRTLVRMCGSHEGQTQQVTFAVDQLERVVQAANQR